MREEVGEVGESRGGRGACGKGKGGGGWWGVSVGEVSLWTCWCSTKPNMETTEGPWILHPEGN